MGRKMNPSEPESESNLILNLRGHHIYKKSEACPFQGFKIVLNFLMLIKTRIVKAPYGPENESKRTEKLVWVSYLQEIGNVPF